MPVGHDCTVNSFRGWCLLSFSLSVSLSLSPHSRTQNSLAPWRATVWIWWLFIFLKYYTSQGWKPCNSPFWLNRYLMRVYQEPSTGSASVPEDPVPSVPGVKLIWERRQPEKTPKPEALSTGGLGQDFSQEAAKLYLSICPLRLSSLPRHHPEVSDRTKEVPGRCTPSYDVEKRRRWQRPSRAPSP